MDIYTARFTIEECVNSFLDIMPEKNYDSIICSNDTVAIYLINSMRALGYNLPEDCYIIGMGYSFLVANHSISVSSVMFNYIQMGEQSVNLYHIVAKSTSPCHYTVSLPCCFMPGLSTGDSSSMGYPVTLHDGNGEYCVKSEDKYFNGSAAQKIIELEAVFQNCNQADRQIIFGLLRGDSVKKIAEQIFLTPRAVRYRMKNFFKRYTTMSQNEFLRSLSDILN